MHITELGINWSDLIYEVRASAMLLYNKDFSQPVKPYLRYRNPKNRIIAMPAYIGGDYPSAGIKWISSFPDNIYKGLPRAHAVTILNNVDSGQPLCIINSAIISGIRTASVTALVIEEYLKAAKQKELTAAINGFGPIGRIHLQMLESLFGNRIKQYLLNDVLEDKTTELPQSIKHKIEVLHSWKEIYQPADIFITCTVSDERYIDLPPKKGSLQLNISLRDYVGKYWQYVDLMIVDDWKEVCRENTDIEMMHTQFGLKSEDTINIGEFLALKKFNGIGPDEVIMFNPMGLAIFDITVANYFYRLAMDKKIGVWLDD